MSKILLLFAAILISITSCTENDVSATTVHLDAISEKYPIWLNAFTSDFNSLIKHADKVKDHRTIFTLDETEIDNFMHSSVATKSNMTSSLKSMIDKLEIVPYEPNNPYFYFPLYRSLLPKAFSKATPIGIGGTYKPSGDGIIVYLEFEFTKHKDPYKGKRPPQHGEFVREQKAFVIYKLVDEKLKLWSLSKEFINVLESMRKSEVDRVKKRFEEFRQR